MRLSVPHPLIENYLGLGRELGLPVAGQIGYVVDDIDTASKELGPGLGVSIWYRPRVVKQKLVCDHMLIEQKLKIAVGYAGPTQVELVQKDSARNSLFESISTNTNYEPHHIGFFLRNLETQCARLDKLGLQPIQHGSIWFARRHRTRVAYFDTRSRLDKVIELIEHRVHGRYIGMPRWYVMLGAMTGHVERL